MPLRQLIDWVYFLCAENSTKEDLDALDRALEEDYEVKPLEDAQEDRRAAILAMGGGVA